MKIKIDEECVQALLDPNKHYSTQIVLPFESQEMKMKWFEWYMNHGQKQFFTWANINGVALGEFKK